LVDVETGKPIRALIGGDRLKKYTADDRDKFSRRLPGIGKENQGTIAKSQPTEQFQSDGFELAIRIERVKISGGKKLYLVLFKERSKFWCSEVLHGLLQEYRIPKSRNRRRKKTQ